MIIKPFFERGVARFLRSLFDDETGRGRTAVAVDQLLAGKSRKEASRMFFETLVRCRTSTSTRSGYESSSCRSSEIDLLFQVLSTKDFILVEQENSFKNISIKPRSKLLKSEF